MINVGDRVKCIDVSYGTEDAPIPLILNRDYLVYGVCECNCGMVSYDVGILLKETRENTGRLYCTCCNRLMGKSGEPYYFKSSRFVKVEENKEYKVVEVAKEIKEQKKDLVLN